MISFISSLPWQGFLELFNVILVSGIVIVSCAFLLYLLVYSAAGERIFESYAGLDLVHEVDFATSGQAITVQWRLRRQRLADESALREGVALAFYPYLPLRAEFAGESP